MSTFQMLKLFRYVVLTGLLALTNAYAQTPSWPLSAPTALTQEAPYLLFDNFFGAPSALNGKAPVIGNGANTYQVTGANLANSYSGNGNAMLNVTSGNAYVQYQLASAPGEIGFTFEFAQSNATGARPTAANSASLINPATSSFVHPQISLTQFSPDFFVNGTPNTPSWFDNNTYPTLSINTVYTARIFIEAPYLHMYLFDPSGTQIGYLSTYDPGFANAIGGGTFVFFQLFDGASSLVPYGVTYHSWWARAKAKQTASNSYFQGGIDQAPIGLRTPAPARFTSINVGNGNPGGKFAVGYNSSTDAIPTISDANPGADTTIKLRSTGGTGGAKFQFAAAANYTHSIGVLNDATGYIQDYNNINWLVRPPYDGVNEYSRYPYTTAGIRIGGSAGPYWYSGAGVPAIDAPIGSLYSNTSGGAATTLYVKTATGAGGWTAK